MSHSPPVMMGPTMLLLLSLACTRDDQDSATAEVWISESCSEAVKIPTGLLPDQDVSADPHQDVLGSSPAPTRIRYQWPSEDTHTSAAFLWSTDTDTLASAVQLGPADGFPDSATQYEGASFLYGSGEVGTGDHRLHEVRLCGRLTPSTTYSYRVGGEGAWSDTYTFTTPGEPGSFDSFRVGIAGDSRGAYETWGQVVAAFDSAEVDFIMFSGDMVEVGSNQEEWDAWLDAAGHVLARRPLVPAHGNHEFLSQNYFAQFALPNNEEWFSITYGNLLLVSLNDTVRKSEQLSTEQAEYLDAVLSEAGDVWKFTMHHQSAFSTCTRHGSDLDVRDAWVPMYDRHEVDIAFAGHNHIYERSTPIRDGEVAAEGEGTVYIVTGGAGAPLYDESETEWFSNVATAVNHYLIADVSAESVTVTAYDLSGNTIDSFSVPR